MPLPVLWFILTIFLRCFRAQRRWHQHCICLFKLRHFFHSFYISSILISKNRMITPVDTDNVFPEIFFYLFEFVVRFFFFVNRVFLLKNPWRNMQRLFIYFLIYFSVYYNSPFAEKRMSLFYFLFCYFPGAIIIDSNISGFQIFFSVFGPPA